MPRERSTAIAALALCAAGALFAWLLFARLGHPLFWHDESETAAFAERVLRFGFPKVHDGHNTLYSLWPGFRRAGVGIDEASDAYTGSPWLQYYVGAAGVALGAGSDDLYARTAWVRLPFALIGCAGLALLFAAVRPSLGSARARGLAFAAVFALLLAGSVLLLLHLREARHYALTTFGAGAFCFALLRRHAQEGLGYASYALLLCGALLWLFHSFHPAALAFGASGALWLALRAWRRGGSAGTRLAWLAREGAPFALAALATAPCSDSSTSSRRHRAGSSTMASRRAGSATRASSAGPCCATSGCCRRSCSAPQSSGSPGAGPRRMTAPSRRDLPARASSGSPRSSTPAR